MTRMSERSGSDGIGVKGALAILFAGLAPLAAGGLAGGATAPIPAALEPGEELPGGEATSRESVDNRDAFSHFSHGIGLEGESKFKIGNAIFRRLWVSAPASTESADGLGPLYNARGCQNCHLKDGRGHPAFGQLAAGRGRVDVPAPLDSARDRGAAYGSSPSTAPTSSASRSTAGSCRISPSRARRRKATCTSTMPTCRSRSPAARQSP